MAAGGLTVKRIARALCTGRSAGPCAQTGRPLETWLAASVNPDRECDTRSNAFDTLSGWRNIGQSPAKTKSVAFRSAVKSILSRTLELSCFTPRIALSAPVAGRSLPTKGPTSEFLRERVGYKTLNGGESCAGQWVLRNLLRRPSSHLPPHTPCFPLRTQPHETRMPEM